jgi:hypothetical protein
VAYREKNIDVPMGESERQRKKKEEETIGVNTKFSHLSWEINNRPIES